MCDREAYAALMEAEADRENAAKLACVKNIDAEKRRDFGPPQLWQVWNSACKGACETWDAIHENARGKAKCTCEEVGTCDENTAYLLCKHIWICMSVKILREPLFFRSNALHCTAVARGLIPAECSPAVS